MNPWAFVVIGIGVLLIIVGVKNSYENVVKAFTGHYNTTSLTAFNPGSSGNPPPIATTSATLMQKPTRKP
jgi:hypothetical protein